MARKIDRSARKSKILVLEEAKELENFNDSEEAETLDPAKDFQYKNWAGTDFRGCDLRNHDFTGSDLSNCKFENALVEGATFDLARLNGTNLKKAKDWIQLLLKSKPNPRGLSTKHLKPYSLFQDAVFAPEMVLIPPGEYLRGSSATGKNKNERPQEKLKIDYKFAVSRFPITFNEWDFAVSHGGCDGYKPSDSGWGRGWNPVTNISWTNARAYTHWLSKNTGEKYRLLSEAEWEYCCRAGSITDFYYGNNQEDFHHYAWYSANSNKQAQRVGQKRPNKFGLYDMMGNVWEWCEDHWHDSYHGGPKDGKAWVTSGYDFNNPRILRGGSWNSNMPENMRCASRSKVNAGYIHNAIGFRVARTITK